MRTIALTIIAMTLLFSSCKKEKGVTPQDVERGVISNGNYADKITFGGQTYQLTSGVNYGYASNDTVWVEASGTTSGGQDLTLEFYGVGQSGGNFTVVDGTTEPTTGQAVIVATMSSGDNSQQDEITSISGSANVTWGTVNSKMTATFNNVQFQHFNLTNSAIDTVTVSGTIDGNRLY